MNAIKVLELSQLGAYRKSHAEVESASKEGTLAGWRFCLWEEGEDWVGVWRLQTRDTFCYWDK